MTQLSVLQDLKTSIEKDDSLSAEERKKKLRRIRKQIRAARGPEKSDTASKTPESKAEPSKKTTSRKSSRSSQSTHDRAGRPRVHQNPTENRADYEMWKYTLENRLTEINLFLKNPPTGGMGFDMFYLYEFGYNAEDLVNRFIGRLHYQPEWWGYLPAGESQLIVVGPIKSRDELS